MNARVRLTGLLVLVAVSIGIAQFKQNVVAAHDLASDAPTVTDALSAHHDRDTFVRTEALANGANVEIAAHVEPAQRSRAAPQSSSSSEDEGASAADVGLMLLFAGGLAMLQLRRRQKSLKHLSLSAV